MKGHLTLGATGGTFEECAKGCTRTAEILYSVAKRPCKQSPRLTTIQREEALPNHHPFQATVLLSGDHTKM